MTLSAKIENLPMGRYVLGNNAYVCTEHLLTPYPGEQRRLPKNDTYNFHLSQLHIRIEMTFGRFMTQWGLFQKPLQLKVRNVGKVFLVAAMLHNFCETENHLLGVGGEEADLNDDDFDENSNFVPSDVMEQVDGNSMMRDIMVERIYHSGQARPYQNRRASQ